MSNLKIKLNYKGVRTLLKSDEMKDVCNKKASQIAKRCGDGYDHDIFVGRGRVNASVGTKTKKAMLDNSENNTILKNVR